ncbi:hypothetical protein [Flavobacterium sp. UBA7682]|uniref:hypothetical protein n=1 Tax=Flavobacterium sp. UBA7682 TaxID=1946560 RepID=UPI0025C1C83A|nr:hypothetical protein [Flavobacterium sp. UBA7682]
MKNLIIFSWLIIGFVSNAQAPQSYSSFLPEPGKYLVSGWVKEDRSHVKTYDKSFITINLLDIDGVTPMNTYSFLPQGNIIDGWQQIVGVIEVTANHKYIDISLINDSDSFDVFFDDIRFLPFQGNMKSFAYDSETLRLMAELDENNYATFYEYDLEGGLVRVKKETEKGIFTIQETRSSTKKNGN